MEQCSTLDSSESSNSASLVKQYKRILSKKEEARRALKAEFLRLYKGPDRVYVGNLPQDVTPLQVELIFRKNSVCRVDIGIASMRPRGSRENEKYATVKFRNALLAYKALRKNGTVMEGRPILVTPFFTELPHYREYEDDAGRTLTGDERVPLSKGRTEEEATWSDEATVILEDFS